MDVSDSADTASIAGVALACLDLTSLNDDDTAESIDALGAEIGWLGLGLLVGERWGRALVLRIDGGPLEIEGETGALVAGIVEGALEAWTGRPARAAIIDRTMGRIRVLVGGPRAVALAREAVAAGADHHEVLRRLHAADRSRTTSSGSPR